MPPRFSVGSSPWLDLSMPLAVWLERSMPLATPLVCARIILGVMPLTEWLEPSIPLAVGHCVAPLAWPLPFAMPLGTTPM